MEEGDYKGLEFVELRATEHLKGNQLSLKNTTTAIQKDQNFLKIPRIPNDPYCLYNLLYRQVFEFMPPDVSEDRILRREAPKKLLKSFKSSGLKYRANPHSTGVWGCNNANTCSVRLANIWEYDNPHYTMKCSTWGAHVQLFRHPMYALPHIVTKSSVFDLPMCATLSRLSILFPAVTSNCIVSKYLILDLSTISFT